MEREKELSLAREKFELYKDKLRKELRGINRYLLNTKWKSMQNALMDKITRDVYKANTVKDAEGVLEKILRKEKWKEITYEKKEKVEYHLERRGGIFYWETDNRTGQIESSDIQDYLFRRYYNFKTSKIAESIFCMFNGCNQVANEKDKEKDIYINGIPFDIKLTSKDGIDFSKYDKQEKVNGLINWFYDNQSKCRTHHKNRLFVVVEDTYSKMDVNNMFEHIATFVLNRDNKPFNKVVVTQDGIKKEVYSDVIFNKN